MSKRIEQSRKHGPFDPRYPNLFQLVPPRNPDPVSPSPPAEKPDSDRQVPS